MTPCRQVAALLQVTWPHADAKNDEMMCCVPGIFVGKQNAASFRSIRLDQSIDRSIDRPRCLIRPVWLPRAVEVCCELAVLSWAKDGGRVAANEAPDRRVGQGVPVHCAGTLLGEKRSPSPEEIPCPTLESRERSPIPRKDSLLHFGIPFPPLKAP